MGTQESNCSVGARFARNFTYLDARITQWELCLQLLRSHVVEQHIAGYPLVEESFTLVARHETTDLVAHHDLQIVRESRARQNVLQLRRQARIRVCFIVEIELWL